MRDIDRVLTILRRPGMIWAAIVLLIALGATIGAWRATKLAVDAKAKVEFEFAAGKVAAAIQQRIDDYTQVLWGGIGLFAASNQVTRREWRVYVDALKLDERLPGVQGIGFALLVPSSGREAHIHHVRAEGFPDYTIWPEGVREEYTSIVYLEPFDWRNQRAFGYDMFTEPVRRAAMERARDNGTPAVSGKVRLVQETETDIQNGFLIYLPAYRAGAPLDTVEDRRAALRGYVYSPFRVNDLIVHGVLRHQPAAHGLEFEIHDGPSAGEDTLLYRSEGFPAGPRLEDAAWLSGVLPVTVGDRPWTFRFAALPSFGAGFDRQWPLVVLGAGIVISLLASSVVGALAVNRAQAVEANRRLSADVARRERVEEELRHSEQMARDVIASSLDAFIQIDSAGLITEWNPQAAAVFGWSRDEAIGQVLANLIVPPERRARHKEGIARFLRTGEGPILGQRVVLDALRRDGSEIRVELTVTALHQRDGYVFNGFVRDLTERLAAEEQIRQSQKMDAVGQLTGGVAHDFNNILTVIIGSTEILESVVADNPKLAQVTSMISRAATRGAELTRQLLAFARKQPLQPRETDVNALIVEAVKLLRPSLGERVAIETALEDDASPALVDPSQLITALVNLALNARDAMPNGGRLLLETGNVVLDEGYARMNAEVRPGPYVMIAVSDTGIGIPAALRDKVFEPFFTTKEVGKGTGLGLSMVYGFVKQSGGHIKIYSEEGHGTVVKLYLPRAVGAAETHADGAAQPAHTGGRETVLVVEDDELVRSYVVAQLESLGYATVTAANAKEALAHVERGAAFDVLFTDVIMPGGLNGRELADEARKRRPGVRVLFTSGYTENAIVHHGQLDPGVWLLPKPYRKTDLARKIREVLDAPQG